MFHGWQLGVNDRRICPDCERECPETARVCPHCGRKFRQLFPPALGRGYALPFAVGGGPVFGLVGHWLRLSPAAMNYLFALPPAAMLLTFVSLLRSPYSYLPRARPWERVLIVLMCVLCVALIAATSYVWGSYLYYHAL